MSNHVQPSDLELAALISSKICHDVIGPVGAIYNGLEILNDDDDAASQSYALDVIRNVTEQASARLQFARFAFGAAGSAGAEIELETARQISQGLVGEGKHKLHWNGVAAMLPKNQVKLLLNLIACAITALPRGGDITVDISTGSPELSFVLRCSGRGARLPQYLSEFVSGSTDIEIDALSIHAYYTWRLASETDIAIAFEHDGNDVILSARKAI
ncbi:MAG: histidine phosphotransferase ChpT [Hyphomicrobiaceae bacterium]